MEAERQKQFDARRNARDESGSSQSLLDQNIIWLLDCARMRNTEEGKWTRKKRVQNMFLGIVLILIGFGITYIFFWDAIMLKIEAINMIFFGILLLGSGSFMIWKASSIS